MTEIGVDEVMWRVGKRKYLTVVYQINEGFRRLLWIGEDRKEVDPGGVVAAPVPENLKREQKLSLKKLLKINLKTVRAYLLKEERRKLLHQTP